MKQKPPMPTLMHAAGRECPEGYQRVEGVWIQPDGTAEAAYVKMPGPLLCEHPRPGETVRMEWDFGPAGHPPAVIEQFTDFVGEENAKKKTN